MSALSIPGSVATHEDIGHFEKRMDEQVALLREAIARLDERVTMGLAAVTRMQNWNFALLVLVLGALLARIVF